ncbi:MAG: sigma-70 family RNA polymerase sigma factor [Aestuariivita sp.]|nr:sigma-70 family RNA polymerase sigma factor [Aestuariivita sp.]
MSCPVSIDNNKESSVDWVTHMQRINLNKDQDAFVEVFYHFAPRVKGFLIKSGTDAMLAEECTQDVMATVWHKANLFDPTRASLATWIFTIARNKRIDLLKKERRPDPKELHWEFTQPVDQEAIFALQQENEKLRYAILDLPESQRQLVEQVYFGELSHRQVAEDMGLPLGTIKSRIRLALEKLRHRIKKTP